MTRRDLIWKWASYGIVLVLVVIFNYYVLTLLPLGAVPLLPMAAAVAVGVLEGPASGAGFGIAAGIALAAATHGSPFWVAYLSAAGCLCGLLAQYVLRRDLVGYVPSCLAVSALYECWQVLSHLVTGQADFNTLIWVAGLEFLWTIAFSFPIYGMCRFCCRHYGRIYHE